MPTKIGCPHHGTDALYEEGQVGYQSRIVEFIPMTADNDIAYEGSTVYIPETMEPKRIICRADRAASGQECGFIVWKFLDENPWWNPEAMWEAGR
jgi:hypothetical protein